MRELMFSFMAEKEKVMRELMFNFMAGKEKVMRELMYGIASWRGREGDGCQLENVLIVTMTTLH